MLTAFPLFARCPRQVYLLEEQLQLLTGSGHHCSAEMQQDDDQSGDEHHSREGREQESAGDEAREGQEVEHHAVGVEHCQAISEQEQPCASAEEQPNMGDNEAQPSGPSDPLV